MGAALLCRGPSKLIHQGQQVPGQLLLAAAAIAALAAGPEGGDGIVIAAKPDARFGHAVGDDPVQSLALQLAAGVLFQPLGLCGEADDKGARLPESGRAHVSTPVTRPSRLPSS